MPEDFPLTSHTVDCYLCNSYPARITSLHPSSHTVNFCQERHQGPSFLPAILIVNIFAIPRLNRERKGHVHHRAMRKTLGFVKLLDLFSVIWSTLDEDAKPVAMSRPWYLRRFSTRCKASAARDSEEMDLPPTANNTERRTSYSVSHDIHSWKKEKV